MKNEHIHICTFKGWLTCTYFAKDACNLNSVHRLNFAQLTPIIFQQNISIIFGDRRCSLALTLSMSEKHHPHIFASMTTKKCKIGTLCVKHGTMQTFRIHFLHSSSSTAKPNRIQLRVEALAAEYIHIVF